MKRKSKSPALVSLVAITSNSSTIAQASFSRFSLSWPHLIPCIGYSKTKKPIPKLGMTNQVCALDLRVIECLSG
jgi:hypothetical protein